MWILSFLLGLILNWICILATNCPKEHLLCDVNKCISPKNICDALNDCTDGLDEKGCECVKYGYYLCKQTRKCYFHDDICNGVDDCNDGTDETNCTTTTVVTTIESTTVPPTVVTTTESATEDTTTERTSTTVTTTSQPDTMQEVTKKEAIDPMDLCQGAPYIHRLSTGKTKCLNCFCMNTNSSCGISSSMKRPRLYKNSSKCISNENYHIKNETFNITKDFPKYSGDHITAYGGQIVIETDESNPINYIEIFMEGSNITLRRIKKNNATCCQIKIRAIENKWKVKTENRNRFDKWATREQLMIVLSNIKTIRLKASINYILNDTIKIRDFVMTKADQEVSSSDKRRIAHEVEICKCPKGRSGNSCEKCEHGYKIKITYANETFSTECLLK